MTRWPSSRLTTRPAPISRASPTTPSWAAFRPDSGSGGPAAAASATLPPAMLEEARRQGGGGRKLLAHGEGGFHSTYSTMPPGYAMVPHRHDHDELMVIVAGGATFGDGGTLVGPGDSVVVPAGVVHSFVCGAE